MSFPIHHHPEDQEFTATIEGHNAELAYSQLTSKLIDFSHTYVDEALRGRGVAEAMARKALDYARDQGMRVRTSCKFMASFVKRNAEYQDLLAERE